MRENEQKTNMLESEVMLDGALDSFINWNMTLSVVGELEVNL